MQIAENIFYIGCNDHEVDLFEGQYKVPNGMAYNSYIVRGNRSAVIDTMEVKFIAEWLDKISAVLDGKAPDYLVVQHMEPDHAAGIAAFMSNYRQATIVASAKAFAMMKNFFGDDYADRRIVAAENSQLDLGGYNLTFVTAPMVHWPEVIVSYESTTHTLFSADGFGKFGALDVDEDWACEARRYYIGIVGKYGAQVQALLRKAAALDIARICPAHGPVLTENLGYYLDLYNTWSSYDVESEGVMIAYTSVYGHTRKAVEILAEKLRFAGCPKVVVCDLAREDMAEAVEDAFRYGKLILATTTYNAEIFPFMREFIHHLVERNYQKRLVGIIENGSWAPMAAKVIRAMLEKCKDLTFAETTVTIKGALDATSSRQLDDLAAEFSRDYTPSTRFDQRALFAIGYGLYVATAKSGNKDNGMIVNAVSQVTNLPKMVAVTINKDSYTHHLVKESGLVNLNCLDTTANFELIQRFGFQSGRNCDKFAGLPIRRSANGLAVLESGANALISLKVKNYVDLGTHGMFICEVTELEKLSDADSITYDYYFKHLKPQPKKTLRGYVCKICGYVYEGDTLPEDFVCPLCKHGAADFEKLN